MTFAPLLAILRAMRNAALTVAAIRTALSTRGELFLESLALHHQLGVLVRSDRRVRPSDRLFWRCLRRWWPRWRDALVLVQPATVARWEREGVRGCWRRRSRRRPGRPCIDAAIRALIRRMAIENRLWDAPRIHGELLKLGIVVSERTVSRYLPDRRTVPSQTWRTFLANHVVHLAWTSPVTSSYARTDDDVVDAGGVSLHPAPSFRDGRCTFNQLAVVDWPPARQHTSLGWRVAGDPRHHRRRTPSGRDPPADVSRRLVSSPTRRFPSFRDVIWLARSMSGPTRFARQAAAGSPSHADSACIQAVDGGGPQRRRSGIGASV